MKRTISMRASVFWRCLLAFVVFWAVLMGVLTAQEEKVILGDLERKRLSNDGLLSAWCKNAAENGWPEGDRWAMSEELTRDWLFLTEHGVFCYIIYDGERQAARSMVSYGEIWLTQDSDKYRLALDAVLTDAEHTALAQALRDGGKEWPQEQIAGRMDGGVGFLQREALGGCGEVVGWLGDGVLYPKTITLFGEEENVTVLEATAEILEGKPLTAYEFYRGELRTTLLGGDPAAQLARLRALEKWSGLDQGRPGVSKFGNSILGTQNSTRPENTWCALGHVDGTREGPTSALAMQVDLRAMAVARIADRGTYQKTFAGMAVAALLLSLWLSWRLSKPLAELSKAVEDEKLPYQPDTRIREVNVMARAVNEAQKKLSDDLERQRELTRAVAHELKTPAAVLRAYAEGLAEDIAPEKREEYLRVLMEESDRMGALVGELLEFSRLEQGTLPLELERVDLAELTERTFRRLELPMEQRGLKLDFDLSPVTLTADPARLGQVLDNLATNALRYADPGPVKVRLTNEGGTARLTVENNCAPIPEEILAKLFEPFYRPDKARSRELGGSGLGLAIVANVVQLHGGTCGAEAVDGGIRFTVELPVKEANEG